MKNKSDDLIVSTPERVRAEICVEASQISLIAEQNLIFCSRFFSLTLQNGGENE